MIGASTNIIVTLLERPGLKALDLLWGLGDYLAACDSPRRAKLLLIR